MDAFDRLAAKPILDGPTQQHYVSSFYLKGFAQSRRVAVYDRTSGAVCLLPPKKAAVLEHLYTFIDDNDRRRFEVEALFGIVESRAGSVLKSAVSKLPLSAEDREYLALFVAMHAIRMPAALAEARSVREKAERAKVKLTVPNSEAAYKLVKESKPPDTTEAELHRLAKEMLEMVSGDHFRISVSDEMARATALKTWSVVAEALFDTDWTIVHASSGGAEYITSDSPVVLSPLSNTADLPLGYASLHAHVLFPLSRRAALIMSGDRRRARHTDASKEQVERLNAAIAADCFRYVIGSDEDLLRSTTEPLNLTRTKWTPRVDVGIGLPPGEDRPAIWIKGLGKRPLADCEPSAYCD